MTDIETSTGFKMLYFEAFNISGINCYCDILHFSEIDFNQ
jgi:hypothetical protein